MKTALLLVLLCLALLFMVGEGDSFTLLRASARQNNGFTLEQVLSSPFPSDLVAAPVGERLAWFFDDQGKRNVWGAEGPDFQPRQLTQYNEDSGQELTDLSFTHDGKWLVYVRGGGPNVAGEIPNPTSDPMGATQAIYAVSFDKGRDIKLAYGDSPVVSPTDNRVVFSKDDQLHIVEITEGSEPHQLFAARGSNFSPQWSPDGKKLAFNSSRGTHSFIGVYDFEKRTIKYIEPSIDRDSAPRWSLDGNRIAFIRQPARGNQSRAGSEDRPEPWAIMVADLGAGEARQVWRSGNTSNDSYPQMASENVLNWAADDRLVFASEMDGWMRLYSIPAGGGQVTALTPTGGEIETMTLTPNRRYVVYSSNHEDIDRRHLWRVPVTGGQPVSLTDSKEEAIQWQPAITGNGKILAYFQTDAFIPSRIVISTFNQVNPGFDIVAVVRDLTFTGADIFSAKNLVKPQPVLFKAADGLDIHGQLFLPKDAKPGEKLPAVIFMHGGPRRQMLLGWHNMYYYHNAYAFNQYLASKGYAVLSVNYRLGVGYGREFRQAKNAGRRGASEYQDIVAGAQYLRSRGDIDQSRIGLWGGSYGGYLAALGLARNSDIFAAGVDLHGVHDWALSPRNSNSNQIDSGNRDAARIAFESSPISSVEKWRSPVLLIHGDDDRNVAFAQTVDLGRRLRELKVPHEIIVYPDEVHDFLLHRHWLEIYNASAKFLDKYFKGAKPAGASQRVSKLDVLIRGGSVIDGAGTDVIKADVGVAGDRIVFVGDAAKENLQADRVIDAAGLIVAPGFIDPHTHADDDLFDPKRAANLAYLTQGVTTVFIGSDGRSRIPLEKALEQLQSQGIGANVASFVGHGSVRQSVMGMIDAAPTPEQLEKMKSLVRQGMDDGAIGLSTGLYYAPGSYAKTEEVIELSKVAAERGGVYDTHQRDESSYTIGLLASIEEIIRIGREAKIPVHISHIKALGADVWGQSGKAIEIINRARAEGVNVTANQYPYDASGTSLGASLLPRWAEAGGRQELLKRIDDPAVRPKLIAEMERNLKRRGGANSLLIHSLGKGVADRGLIGKRLDEIAKSRGKSPVETALEIIKEGGAGVASFNMTESDIENFMKQPWVMTGSDGSGGHPRKYGTYPRKIREYALNRHVITLPRMIQASSAQVAQTFNLKDRGKLSPGYFADVIVFDEKTITDRSTYENPDAFAEGVKYVIVNGKLAIDGGKYTGAMAGRVLRKSRAGD
ncbi:MAG TPA: prolyl oligopeptidase family serine peptidase [Blastocatellia bacterium]|nr:prolyl oligopeptidase family serine peptidase [Blastocatellia bacterium]